MVTCKELILKEEDGEIRTFYDLQAEFSYSSFVSLLCLLSHWGGTVGGMQKYRSVDVGHPPHRPRPDKEGGRPLGSTTPQPAGDPGKGLAHPSSTFPCSPTLNWLVDKSMVAVPNTVRGRGGRDRQKYDEVQTFRQRRAAGHRIPAGRCSTGRQISESTGVL